MQLLAKRRTIWNLIILWGIKISFHSLQHLGIIHLIIAMDTDNNNKKKIKLNIASTRRTCILQRQAIIQSIINAAGRLINSRDLITSVFDNIHIASQCLDQGKHSLLGPSWGSISWGLIRDLRKLFHSWRSQDYEGKESKSKKERSRESLYF